jgi:hypothetical protein
VPARQAWTRAPLRSLSPVLGCQLGLPMDIGKRISWLAYFAICLVGLFGTRADAQTVAKFTRQSDVIYGRKFGAALTMEVFTPTTRNGLGVIWVVSSSGISSREQTLQDSFERRISPLLERGFAVFALSTGARRSLICRTW